MLELVLKVDNDSILPSLKKILIAISGIQVYQKRKNGLNLYKYIF